MKKFATIIATSGLVLGLAACGSSPEEEAEQAVTDFTKAFADKDYEKVCDSIDPAMIKTMEDGGMDCVEGMKSGGADEADVSADDVEVISSEVAEDEETATVKVKNSKGEENDVKLIKVDDAWKISMGS